MESFTIVLPIYNLSMGIIVTPIDTKTCTYKIETTTGGPNPMVIRRLPDLAWVAEKATMKYFTDENIRSLGALIEREKPGLFLP